MSEMTDVNVVEYKIGPLLGKAEVDISTGDYESPYPSKPFFTVAIKTGSGNLHYEDAFGNDHTESWAENDTVMGGHPGSNYPIPLFIRKVFSDSDVTVITVAW